MIGHLRVLNDPHPIIQYCNVMPFTRQRTTAARLERHQRLPALEPPLTGRTNR